MAEAEQQVHLRLADPAAFALLVEENDDLVAMALVLQALAQDGAAKVASLRRLIDATTFEIDAVARRVSAQLVGHRGYRAIQSIHGSVRSSPRSSSWRSVTSLASPGRSSCAPGPD